MQYSVRLVQATAATARIQRVPVCLVEMLQPQLKQKHFFSRAKIQGSGIQLVSSSVRRALCVSI